MRRVWAALVRLRVTIGYAVALVAVAVVLVIEGPRMQDRVVAHASTNLHNLHQGHLGTLIGSAFVTDAGPIYLWLPGLMSILALAELQWRSGRLALTFVLGHIRGHPHRRAGTCLCGLAPLGSRIHRARQRCRDELWDGRRIGSAHLFDPTAMAHLVGVGMDHDRARRHCM